ESPRELSSALTGRLEISTATTIRHSQPAELDLVEQGGRFSPRGPTRPLPLWTSPQLSPRPAVVASVTVVSGFRDAFPGPWKRRSQAMRERKTSVLRACRPSVTTSSDVPGVDGDGPTSTSPAWARGTDGGSGRCSG